MELNSDKIQWYNKKYDLTFEHKGRLSDYQAVLDSSETGTEQ